MRCDEGDFCVLEWAFCGERTCVMDGEGVRFRV